MNRLVKRWLKAKYHQEPIVSVIFIMGIVDGVMGGVGQQWSLLGFGVALGGISLGLRWLKNPPAPRTAKKFSPRGYLPPVKEVEPLPELRGKTSSVRKEGRVR